MDKAIPEPPAQEKTVFQVFGITCLDCAQKFEQHVNRLPGVSKASLNAVSGKLTIEASAGAVSLEAVRELGRSENYTIERAGAFSQAARQPRDASKIYLIRSVVSVVFLVCGYAAEQLGGHIQIIMDGLPFYALAVIVGGWGNFKKAFYSITSSKKLTFNMSILMSVAVIGALFIGEYQEAASVAFLYCISEMLESWTMEKTRRSISSLMNIAPNTALVKKTGKETVVPVENVSVGDVIIVRPGQKIALDGLVVKGNSAINQAPITGESIPVEKNLGDEVFAGTLNTYGLIEVEVSKLVQDTTIAKIIHMVEEAQGKRARSQAFIEKFAAIYTPVVMALSALIILIPPLFLGHDWLSSLYRGLALLVVSCPCALIISTPVAIVSAISSAAGQGVLIKGGMHLENMGSVSAIALDKTGTLTKGCPVVTDIIPINFKDENSLLSLAASLEVWAEHPLSLAIIKAAENKNLSIKPAQSLSAILGKGAKGIVDGQTVYIGSLRLFEEAGHCLEEKTQTTLKMLKEQGKTVMLVGTKETLFGIIAAADELRPGIDKVITSLRKAGVSYLAMLTGDNKETAASVALNAGLDDFKAELLPEGKVSIIEELLGKYKKTAMVGDGVNDAPALAVSTVGIAMGGAGNDTALETADIVLMGDSLDRLPFVIGLSRRTLRVIRQNIAFSISVKVLAVLAVFPGWLTLWLAILADTGAAIIVTLNSLRLFRT